MKAIERGLEEAVNQYTLLFCLQIVSLTYHLLLFFGYRHLNVREKSGIFMSSSSLSSASTALPLTPPLTSPLGILGPSSNVDCIVDFSILRKGEKVPEDKGMKLTLSTYSEGEITTVDKGASTTNGSRKISIPRSPDLLSINVGWRNFRVLHFINPDNGPIHQLGLTVSTSNSSHLGPVDSGVVKKSFCSSLHTKFVMPERFRPNWEHEVGNRQEFLMSLYLNNKDRVVYVPISSNHFFTQKTDPIPYGLKDLSKLVLTEHNSIPAQGQNFSFSVKTSESVGLRRERYIISIFRRSTEERAKKSPPYVDFIDNDTPVWEYSTESHTSKGDLKQTAMSPELFLKIEGRDFNETWPFEKFLLQQQQQGLNYKRRLPDIRRVTVKIMSELDGPALQIYMKTIEVAFEFDKNLPDLTPKRFRPSCPDQKCESWQNIRHYLCRDNQQVLSSSWDIKIFDYLFSNSSSSFSLAGGVTIGRTSLNPSDQGGASSSTLEVCFSSQNSSSAVSVVLSKSISQKRGSVSISESGSTPDDSSSEPPNRKK